MKFEKDTSGIKRYIGFDIHKDYALVGGQNAGQEWALKTKNRAGQAFRMAAQSVKRANNPFGLLYRRLRARLGPAQATVATARAIARVVCKMLKYKVEYNPLSVNEYQAKYEEQQVKYMRKRAAKLGYRLVPA